MYAKWLQMLKFSFLVVGIWPWKMIHLSIFYRIGAFRLVLHVYWSLVPSFSYKLMNCENNSETVLFQGSTNRKSQELSFRTGSWLMQMPMRMLVKFWPALALGSDYVRFWWSWRLLAMTAPVEMWTLKSFTVLTAFFFFLFLSCLPLLPAVLQSLVPLNLLVGAWLTCPRCC